MEARLCAGWALAAVTSRAFRVAGPSQPASMLPLIDMCNHSFAPNCKLQTSGNGDVQLVTLHHISQQQPLQLSYGNLSNDFLLMDYGFVVPGNPFDRVQLSFSLELLEVHHHHHHHHEQKSTWCMLDMLCSPQGAAKGLELLSGKNLLSVHAWLPVSLLCCVSRNWAINPRRVFLRGHQRVYLLLAACMAPNQSALFACLGSQQTPGLFFVDSETCLTQKNS